MEDGKDLTLLCSHRPPRNCAEGDVSRRGLTLHQQRQIPVDRRKEQRRYLSELCKDKQQPHNMTEVEEEVTEEGETGEGGREREERGGERGGESKGEGGGGEEEKEDERGGDDEREKGGGGDAGAGEGDIEGEEGEEKEDEREGGEEEREEEDKREEGGEGDAGGGGGEGGESEERGEEENDDREGGGEEEEGEEDDEREEGGGGDAGGRGKDDGVGGGGRGDEGVGGSGGGDEGVGGSGGGDEGVGGSGGEGEEDETGGGKEEGRKGEKEGKGKKERVDERGGRRAGGEGEGRVKSQSAAFREGGGSEEKSERGMEEEEEVVDGKLCQQREDKNKSSQSEIKDRICLEQNDTEDRNAREESENKSSNQESETGDRISFKQNETEDKNSREESENMSSHQESETGDRISFEQNDTEDRNSSEKSDSGEEISTQLNEKEDRISLENCETCREDKNSPEQSETEDKNLREQNETEDRTSHKQPGADAMVISSEQQLSVLREFPSPASSEAGEGNSRERSVTDERNSLEQNDTEDRKSCEQAEARDRTSREQPRTRGSERGRIRAGRFVTGQEEDVETLRPFYDGDYVSRRMNEIRKSINYIRENWGRYEEFLMALKRLIREIPEEEHDPDLLERSRSLFSSRKDWKDTVDETNDDQFDAIRVYTSEVGYGSFFAVINAIFRKDESAASEETIRAAVFLVELINIDLFNFCLKNPTHGNFQGTVYRGLSVSPEDLQRFRELFTRPVSQRYISVPLGLMSTSLLRGKAEEFLSLSVATSDPNTTVFPLLMIIHVIELNPEHLRFYKATFPDSVVTGICAVNIQDLSFHPEEREVILRGPFFQVLRLGEGDDIGGRGSHVLEMVMLNANRDHVTSVRMGDREDVARRMFGTMVAVTRCEFCVHFCRRHELWEDERQYQRMLDEKRDELTTMMQE